MLCKRQPANGSNYRKPFSTLLIAAVLLTLVLGAEKACAVTKSSRAKGGPRKSSDPAKSLVQLLENAKGLRSQDDYAKLASALHKRRTLIKNAKAGASELLDIWIEDGRLIAEADAAVQKGQYKQAVDLLESRWKQRSQANPLNGDLGIALIRASLAAVVIEDRPVLSREQMKPILDEIIERDPTQVEAAVIRAWMIDADPSEEYLRLESRPSIIERNRRLLPLKQSFLADKKEVKEQDEETGTGSRNDRGGRGGRGRPRTDPTEEPQAWPASEAGVPETLSRFVQSVIAYCLGMSRTPVFDEIELCDDFFGRSLLLTDSSGTKYYFYQGSLWQNAVTSEGFQWRYLVKKQKGNKWNAYDLFVVRWAGKDVQLAEHEQLYNLLASRDPIKNGDLGRMGAHSLAVYDSSSIFVSDLYSLDIYVCNVSAIRAAWKGQKVAAIGEPQTGFGAPGRSIRGRRDTGRNLRDTRTREPIDSGGSGRTRLSTRESKIRPLIEKNQEGRVLVFTERELLRLESKAFETEFPTIAEMTSTNLLDLTPIFAILDKTPGSIAIDFYHDDQGNRYLLNSRQQKVFFPDFYMLEMRTGGYERGSVPRGVLIRPTWFSHFEKELEDLSRVLKWAQKSSQAQPTSESERRPAPERRAPAQGRATTDQSPAALAALIQDIETYGLPRKSVDDLLFNAVFKKKRAISLSKRIDVLERETVMQTHRENIRQARDYFVRIPFGFDPRGRLFIYTDANDLVFLDQDGAEVERQFYLPDDLSRLRENMIADFIIPSYEAVPNPLLAASHLPDREGQWDLMTMRQKAQAAFKSGNLHLAATLYRDMPALDIGFPEVSTLQSPSSEDIKNVAGQMQQAILAAAMKVQCKLEFASILALMGRGEAATHMMQGARAYWELALTPIVKELERYAVSYGYKISDELTQVTSGLTKMLAVVPLAGIESPRQSQSSAVFDPEAFAGVHLPDAIQQKLMSFYEGRPALQEYLKAKQWLKSNHRKLLLRNPANEFEGWAFSWRPLVVSNGQMKNLDRFGQDEPLSKLWNQLLYDVETAGGSYMPARNSLLKAAYHQRDAAANAGFESLDYLAHSVNAIAMLWLATASELYTHGPVRFGTDFVNVTTDELDQFIKPRMLVKLPQSTVNYHLNPILGMQETTLRLLAADRYMAERFFWFEYADLDKRLSPDKKPASKTAKAG
jgi:hypothetical protein